MQMLLDGSDSNTASIALGYAEGLVQTYARARSATKAQISMGAPRDAGPGRGARSRHGTTPTWCRKNFIVPGLIAVIMMIIAALLTSLTIAREWENGTMEQLLSTPVRPIELVFGFWGTLPELHEVIAMARRGLITPHVERFKLEEALHAYELMEQGQLSGRAVVVP